MNKTAVFIVDVQKDFCEGGALAVKGGNSIVLVCNKLIKMAEERGCRVIASRDWHPANHCSFKEFGGIWPAHCVAGTSGADFHPSLALPSDTVSIDKGTAVEKDNYSAFDVAGVGEKLRSLGIERLVMCGLATDYCVKATALGAINEKFDVTVVSDGCAGVNVNPGDDVKALKEMESAGAKVCQSSEVVM